MKLAPTIFSICLLLVSGFFLTCGDDDSTKEADLLGRWNITEAIRDNKPTTTMDGMYFEFAEGGQLQTNMTGEAEAYQYEVDDEQILQRGGTIETDYIIETRLDNQLVLTTMLGGKPFRITLAREPLSK